MKLQFSGIAGEKAYYGQSNLHVHQSVQIAGGPQQAALHHIIARGRVVQIERSRVTSTGSIENMDAHHFQPGYGVITVSRPGKLVQDLSILTK